MYVCLFRRDARVVRDQLTGRSKSYGFVSFVDKMVSYCCQYMLNEGTLSTARILGTRTF